MVDSLCAGGQHREFLKPCWRVTCVLDARDEIFLTGFRIGYGRFGGSKASAKDLADIIHNMELNGLLNPGRLLTGEPTNRFFYILIISHTRSKGIFRELRLCLPSLTLRKS